VADLEYAKILPDVDSESGPERPYAALDDESQTAVIKRFRRRIWIRYTQLCSRAAMGLETESSYGNYAKTHERLFRGLHGIDAPPRNGDLRAISPTEQQLEIASRLSTLSQDFLRETYGDRITVFRGITRTAPTVLAELSRSPTVLSTLSMPLPSPTIRRIFGSQANTVSSSLPSRLMLTTSSSLRISS